MIITNCSLADIPDIEKLHAAARNIQSQKGVVVWPVFEQSMLRNDIEEQRAWKIIQDNTMACTWSITFNDKEIWGELDNNNAIYIHRIATNPLMRGKRYIHTIVNWAKCYAGIHNKQFIRLDTLGNNTALINHYTNAGFDYLGVVQLTSVDELPDHYKKERNCLRFQLSLNQ